MVSTLQWTIIAFIVGAPLCYLGYYFYTQKRSGLTKDFKVWVLGIDPRGDADLRHLKPEGDEVVWKKKGGDLTIPLDSLNARRFRESWLYVADVSDIDGRLYDFRPSGVELVETEDGKQVAVPLHMTARRLTLAYENDDRNKMFQNFQNDPWKLLTDFAPFLMVITVVLLLVVVWILVKQFQLV